MNCKDSHLAQKENMECADKIAKTLIRQCKEKLNSQWLIYGYNSGELALILASYVSSITYMDTHKEHISMLQNFTIEKKLNNIKTHHIIAGDEISEAFDVIVVSMAMHHMPDPLSYVRQFESALNERGTLAIIELAKEDGGFHDFMSTGVFHRGFYHSDISELLSYCYLDEILHDEAVFTFTKHGKKYPLTLTLAGRAHHK